MPVDKFGRMSDTKTKDTGVSLTYINNNYIRSDGGTPVSGSIDMSGNTLYNVSNPVNPHDVATKDYADNKRTHIIAINSQYTGPLRKWHWQFAFGGESKPGRNKDEVFDNPGFLIPHSGRIKKIKIRTPINRKNVDLFFQLEEKSDISIFKDGLFQIKNYKNRKAGKTSVNVGTIHCMGFSEIHYKNPHNGKKRSYWL